MTAAILGPASVALHWRPGEKTPESHQGQPPAFPWWRWDREQCHQRCTLWTHTTGQREHNRAHSRRQPQRRNTQQLPSQWESSSPTCLPPQIRNTSKKQIWGRLLQQLGNRPHLWQDRENHRAKEGPAQYPGQALITPPVNAPYQGNNGTSLWTNLTHQEADTRK